MELFYIFQRLFYTILGVASLFYFIVRISLLHWKKRGILHDKPKFLYGNMSGVGQKRHVTTTMQELYVKYKGRAPFIGFYAYLKPMVLVLDIELVQQVLSTHAEYFIDRGLYHNEAADPLSANLMQLDGENWLQMREKLKPIFAHEKLKFVLPTLVQVSETFGHFLNTRPSLTEEVFDINVLVDRYNVDAISALAFGLPGDSVQQPNTEFRAMARTYFKNFNLVKSYLAINYPNAARLLQYKTYDETATKYFLQLINEKITDREWNHMQTQNDFLQLFIELKQQQNPNQQIFNNKQIAAQAFSFLLVGLQACNNTMAFCLYELAMHPELQEEARHEISEVIRNNENSLTIESIKQMQFLKQILYETLRKYAPYPLLLRNTIKDYEVDNSVFVLQRGNHIVIPVSAIHYDERIYPNPNRFDPARFNPDAVRQRHPMAWLPFGAGRRNCIAQQLAVLQMMIGLATLLKNYTYSPCPETIQPMQYDNAKLLLTPKTDIKLRVDRVKTHL